MEEDVPDTEEDAQNDGLSYAFGWGVMLGFALAFLAMEVWIWF